MFTIDYKNVNWWYFLLCAGGMSAGLFGIEAAFGIAIGSAGLQLLHTMLVWRKDKRHFPLQVRTTYTLLLIVASFEPLHALYWLPAIGTWIYLLFGYCPLARSLSLIPAISGKAFSFTRARQVLFARPVPNILHAANAAH